MSNPIEEIKNKIDIVELISEYVQLKQTGVNYRALCPFHTEKAPSFFVSPERQIWHCFGSCNEGGDIFKFIMKIESIDFPEALKILAKRAGVELARADYHLTSLRTKLLDITRLAASFYHLVLLKSSLGQRARQYLAERGLTEETIKSFQLGFAPDRWDELAKFLLKKDIKLLDAQLAGLVIKSNKFIKNSPTDNYYDRFRNRIIFPINDIYGNPVGFTSRIVPWAEDQEAAKYVNTPETPIYNKSHILYGLDKAKTIIKKENEVIIVEGNMDVIACHQAGSKNVVASSGTALTFEQIKNLKRYTNNFLLAFDVDVAGENATQRGIDLALKEEVNVKIISVPEGKDPDECLKENPEAWFEATKQAKSIMNYYLDFALKDKDLTKIEDQKNVVKMLLPIIAKLGDAVEQNYWLKFLADKLNTPEYSLRDKLKNLKNKDFVRREETQSVSKKTKQQMASEIFLGLFLKYPDLVKDYFLNLSPEVFLDSDLKLLAEAIKTCYNLETKTNLLDYLSQNFSNKDLLDYLGLLVEKEYASIVFDKKGLTENNKKELNNEIKKLFQIIKGEYLKKHCAGLTRQLKEAEKNKQEDVVKDLSVQISKINREIHQL